MVGPLLEAPASHVEEPGIQPCSHFNPPSCYYDPGRQQTVVGQLKKLSLACENGGEERGSRSRSGESWLSLTLAQAQLSAVVGF